MTIKELKERIANLSDDTVVVLPGYDHGYNNVLKTRVDTAFTYSHGRSWTEYIGQPEIQGDKREVFILETK